MLFYFLFKSNDLNHINDLNPTI